MYLTLRPHVCRVSRDVLYTYSSNQHYGYGTHFYRDGNTRGESLLLKTHPVKEWQNWAPGQSDHQKGLSCSLESLPISYLRPFNSSMIRDAPEEVCGSPVHQHCWGMGTGSSFPPADNTLKGTSWLEKLPPKMEAKLLEPNSAKRDGVRLQASEGASLAPDTSTFTPAPISTPWPSEPPLHPEGPSQGE